MNAVESQLVVEYIYKITHVSQYICIIKRATQLNAAQLFHLIGISMDSTNEEQAERHAQRFLVQSKPAAYPSWTAMAGNLARAVGGVASAAVRGEAIVASEEEQARRLAICHACESYEPVGDRCRDCGCYLAWKTRIASQHCPLTPPKW